MGSSPLRCVCRWSVWRRDGRTLGERSRWIWRTTYLLGKFGFGPLFPRIVEGGKGEIPGNDCWLYFDASKLWLGTIRPHLLFSLLQISSPGFSAICPIRCPSAHTNSDGFRLIFINTLHGQVYSQSPKFSIYPSRPGNYTEPGKLTFSHAREY